jgi:hypothetical protein
MDKVSRVMLNTASTFAVVTIIAPTVKAFTFPISNTSFIRVVVALHYILPPMENYSHLWRLHHKNFRTNPKNAVQGSRLACDLRQKVGLTACSQL